MKSVSKYIIIGLIFIVLLVGGYYFLNNPKKASVPLASNYTPDSAYESEFESRDTELTDKAEVYEDASGLIAFSLVDSGVPVPANTTVVSSFYPMTKLTSVLTEGSSNDAKPKWNAVHRTINKARIEKVVATYGKLIKEAAATNKIPYTILLGIISVEHKDSVSIESAKTAVSGTKASGYFYGLGQISIKTAKDSLMRFPKNGWISKSQLKAFESNGLLKNGQLTLTVQNLYDPEINLNAAAATLSGLAHKFGYQDFHKWVFAYNRGEGKMNQQNAKGLTIDELVLKTRGTSNRIGADYITNVLGKDGACDIIWNDLQIRD
jgi:hypothetical protein